MHELESDRGERERERERGRKKERGTKGCRGPGWRCSREIGLSVKEMATDRDRERVGWVARS